MTRQQILSDDNLLCSISTEEQHTDLYLIYQGSDKLAYYMFLQDELLFSGNDYRPSPMFSGVESIESALGCLGFLCAQPGDTDDEYFAAYTDAQMTWAKSYDCEVLKGLIQDAEDTENEYYQDAIKQIEYVAH